MDLLRQSEFDTVVVYCSVGYRSAAMVERLMKLGVKNAFNLEGSIFEWANSGKPVVNDQGMTKGVHPYNDYWGQLLKRELHQTH